MIDVPQVPPNARLPDSERARVGDLLRREYERGRSVRQLCADTGYSIGRVRGLLKLAGVEFRPRGGAGRAAR